MSILILHIVNMQVKYISGSCIISLLGFTNNFIALALHRLPDELFHGAA